MSGITTDCFAWIDLKRALGSTANRGTPVNSLKRWEQKRATEMAKYHVITENGQATNLWHSVRDGGSVGHGDVYRTDKNGNTKETNLHYNPKTGERHKKHKHAPPGTCIDRAAFSSVDPFQSLRGQHWGGTAATGWSRVNSKYRLYAHCARESRKRSILADLRDLGLGRKRIGNNLVVDYIQPCRSARPCGRYGN